MSAWLVSDSHIDVLVWGLIERGEIPPTDADETGRMLLRENHLSLETRYADPMPDAIDYVYVEPAVELKPHNWISAVRCYSYQSCEHLAWEESRAARLTQNAIPDDEYHSPISHDAIVNLATASPWGFDERHVHPNGRLP